MKKFRAMTNREWVARYKPEMLTDDKPGGIVGCPQMSEYHLQNTMLERCVYAKTGIIDICTKCWDLPAKRNGRYIMKEVER